MTGVRLSLRVFNNLHFYSRICQSGSFISSTSQCSICWTHQRHLSKYLTYRPTANGLFQAISGNLLSTPSGNICLYNGVRHKSKKSKKSNRPGTRDEDEEEEEDEDDDAIDPEDISDYEDEPKDDPTIPKDYKDVEKVVPSLRYDVVFGSGLDVARA